MGTWASRCPRRVRFCLGRGRPRREWLRQVCRLTTSHGNRLAGFAGGDGLAHGFKDTRLEALATWPPKPAKPSARRPAWRSLGVNLPSKHRLVVPLQERR